MSASLRSLVVVSTMATMVLASSPYNNPYHCPESKYTSLVENYEAGHDDQYVAYLGVEAPFNWDVNHCGKIFQHNGNQAAWPGTIHYPSDIVPLALHLNDFVTNPHASHYEWLLLGLFGNTSAQFPSLHPWVSSHFNGQNTIIHTGKIDWNNDDQVDWDIYGQAEIAAVTQCQNKWYSSTNPANTKLRRSFHTIQVHRPLNCAKEPSPQYGAGNGDYSPLDAWEQMNVPKDMQRRLVFSILGSKPANPKYIAFFVNGLESCKGYPQGATGSDDGWKVNVLNKDNNGKCSNVPKRDPLGRKGYKWHKGDIFISKHGSASLFMAAPGSPEAYGQDLTVFPKEETLMIAVPDASFGYPDMPGLYNVAGNMGGMDMAKRCGVRNSAGDNAKLINGWVKWLDAHVDWSNIKGFLGVGASRGGCFVTLLADKLFGKDGDLAGKGAKLILETLDPVCGPREMDAYRYTHGYQMGGTWTQSDKTILASSPVNSIDANLNLIYPAAEENPEYPTYRKLNQCYMMKLDKLFGDTPREDIRWLNTVSGEDVLGELNADGSSGVAWTGIHSFCSDLTAGPAIDPNGDSVTTLLNGSITDTLAEDIKPRGIPIFERFTKNEDGQPVIPGVHYQNLWLDFNNVAYVSGDVETGNKANPFALTTSGDYTYWVENDLSQLKNSNNPMPGFGSQSPACNSWYKQVWVPHSHMTVTGGVYIPANVAADGVGVPCFGQASCGYGVHEPQNPDGSFPLPLQKRQSKVKACIPFPRADIDYQFKHAKHAHDAAVELFQGVNGDPNGVCKGDVVGTNSGDEIPSSYFDGSFSDHEVHYSDTDIGSGSRADGKFTVSYSDTDIGSGARADGKYGSGKNSGSLGDYYAELTAEQLAKKYGSYPIRGESFSKTEETLNNDFSDDLIVDPRAKPAVAYYDERNELWVETDVVLYDA